MTPPGPVLARPLPFDIPARQADVGGRPFPETWSLALNLRPRPPHVPSLWPIEPPMSHDPPVARRRVEITNALGLHLRPADRFVRLANRYQAEIRVQAEGRSINGKSILDLTTLAAECGTLLDIEASGPDAEAAAEALAELVLARFHEDEASDEIGPVA